MNTFADLLTRVRTAVADTGATTWTDDALKTYCQMAIEEYSLYFPRTRTAEITAEAGVEAYDLPADCHDVIQVEYPEGRYLPHIWSWMPSYYYAYPCYDVEHAFDRTAPDQLLLNPLPPGAGTIAIRYITRHADDLEDADVLTVPSRHHNLLVSHALWCAWRGLVSAEMGSPTSSSSLVMGQLAQNMRHARRDFYQLLEEAMRAYSPGSTTVVWEF